MKADRDHRGVFPPAMVGLRIELRAKSATITSQSARPQMCSIPATHRWLSCSGCRRRRQLLGSELGVLPSNEREQEALARFARLPGYLDGGDRVAPRPHVDEDFEAGDAPADNRRVVSRRARWQVFERAVRGPSGVFLPCQQDAIHRCPATEYVGDTDHAARAPDAVVCGYRPTKPTSAKLVTYAGGVADRDVRKSASAGGDFVSLVRRTNVARCQDVTRTGIRRTCRPRHSYYRHQAGQPECEEALP